MKNTAVMILLWTLTACGSAAPDPAEPEQPTEPPPTVVESTPEPGVSGDGATPTAADPSSPTSAEEPPPPPLEPEELTGPVIQRVVRGRLAEFRHCYEARLVLSPRLAGRVTLELVVGAEGNVIEASIHESTIDDAEVDECVVGVGRALRFPPPLGGDDVVVRYPFAFGTGS